MANYTSCGILGTGWTDREIMRMAREQSMRKNNRTGKRLRLIPLIPGGYGTFLGFGLAVIGLAEIKEGIGIVRLLIGLGMAGFGLLGIWDGVRDLVKPDKKPQQEPARQFIITDTSGTRSSLVTPEVLREQISILAESEDPKQFDIQILPPLSAGEYGLLKQILCFHHGNIIMAAFFEMPKDGYRIYQKCAEPDMAVGWLKQLSAGNPDFSGWENTETKVRQDEGAVSQNKGDTWQDEEDTCSDETDTQKEEAETFWHQLLAEQKGQMLYWHKLLVIFGESRHDEHTYSDEVRSVSPETGVEGYVKQYKFFSARDVELAIEGVYEGTYTKVVLEWGTKAFDLFPGVQNDLMVIWGTDNTGKGDTRFMAKEGTVTQVKFWLINYLNHGFFEEMGGWADVTAQIEDITMEREKRKVEKRHGKVF